MWIKTTSEFYILPARQLVNISRDTYTQGAHSHLSLINITLKEVLLYINSSFLSFYATSFLSRLFSPQSVTFASYIIELMYTIRRDLSYLLTVKIINFFPLFSF